MKISLTLTAGITIDNLEMNGLEIAESQKNWDNDKKANHGRQRENRKSLDGLSGSAKADFDMQINFDLQPEEMQSCYSCIKEIVKTVADSHHQTAEAVEKATEAVKKDLSPNPEVEIKVSAFMDQARAARETENATVAKYAILLGNEALSALKKDGKDRNAGTIADIEGIIKASLEKIINDADDHNM